MKHLKSEFDKLTFREFLAYSLAIFSMGAAVICIFFALFLPPKGEIHASVLTYFGLTCGFVGALLGISIHYSNELNKFKAAINEHLAELREAHSETSKIKKFDYVK